MANLGRNPPREREGVSSSESQLRRAMSISLGDPMALLQSPVSATLLAIALVALVAPFVMQGLARFRANED